MSPRAVPGETLTAAGSVGAPAPAAAGRADRRVAADPAGADGSWSCVDAATVERQLGRPPRGVVGVGWRCPLGRPGVVVTAPQLPDGTPFPTTYYLTCPVAVRRCSTLEGDGVMAELTERLGREPTWAAGYLAAHQAYRDDRSRLAARLGHDVTQVAAVSAGGMPDRVKCLHALLAHRLAAGPGVNPLGDEALVLLGDFWAPDCAPRLGEAPRVRRGRAVHNGKTRGEPA